MKRILNSITEFLSLAAWCGEALFANETFTLNAANESWVMLAPYGDWPNVQGLQRFRKEDAQNIVNEFQSLLGLPQRVLGLPWYVGHPDHPAFKDTYKDGSAKGRIKKLEAREDGLWANVKWNDEGKRLIASEAYHGHSVNWRMRQNGGAWSPFSLKSVGFTNDPQIPVPPVLAANESGNEGREEDVVMLCANGTREGVIKSWEKRKRGVGRMEEQSKNAIALSKIADSGTDAEAHYNAGIAHWNAGSEVGAAAYATHDNAERSKLDKLLAMHRAEADRHDLKWRELKPARSTSDTLIKGDSPKDDLYISKGTAYSGRQARLAAARARNKHANLGLKGQQVSVYDALRNKGSSHDDALRAAKASRDNP